MNQIETRVKNSIYYYEINDSLIEQLFKYSFVSVLSSI